MKLAELVRSLPTTNEVVASELLANQTHSIKHIHYDSSGTGKSAQLNFAWQTLRSNLSGTDWWYVAVFDFDARPDRRSFREVASIIESRDSPHLVQQVVLPVLGAAQAPAVAVADAAIHVIRAYTKEAWVWSLSERLHKHPVLYRFLFDVYCVGSGLYIRNDVLAELDGFPSPVDDIPIGYAAGERGWRIAVTLLPCCTQVYPDVKAAITSRTLVFHAYWEHLLKIKSEPLLLLTATTREAFTWLLGPWLAIILLVLLSRSGRRALVARAVAMYLGVSWLQAVAGSTLARRVEPSFPRLSIPILACVPFDPVWRSLSALRLLAMALRTHSEATDLSFGKTRRISK